MTPASKDRRQARACFSCLHLDLRSLKDGRVVFWCVLRGQAVPDAFIWRLACEDFKPAGPP